MNVRRTAHTDECKKQLSGDKRVQRNCALRRRMACRHRAATYWSSGFVSCHRFDSRPRFRDQVARCMRGSWSIAWVPEAGRVSGHRWSPRFAETIFADPPVVLERRSLISTRGIPQVFADDTEKALVTICLNVFKPFSPALPQTKQDLIFASWVPEAEKPSQ